jgi:hypothetical protein
MKNIVKIAIYENNNGAFHHVKDDEYIITYRAGKKPHQLRIVVNSYLSNNVINLVDNGKGYKNQILQAISDFKNRNIDLTNKVSPKKSISLEYINTFYSKLIVRNVMAYLIGISKENSRDKLTKFKLI